jgi:hypothetical protein
MFEKVVTTGRIISMFFYLSDVISQTFKKKMMVHKMIISSPLFTRISKRKWKNYKGALNTTQI